MEIYIFKFACFCIIVTGTNSHAQWQIFTLQASLIFKENHFVFLYKVMIPFYASIWFNLSMSTLLIQIV